MTSARSTARPTFFWQGLLIVLPVVVLAFLGLVSLRQDQRLAQEDARQRAQELLGQLASGLGRRVPARLDLAFAALWDMTYAQSLSAWPGDQQAHDLWETNRPFFARELAKWSAAYPGLEPDTFLFAPAFVSRTGELASPPGYDLTPSPPAWFQNLSPEQQYDWESARALLPSHNAAPAVNFEPTNSLQLPPDAIANAEFKDLRLHLPTNSAAVDQLRRFASKHPHVQTEAGLPIPAVACALALERIASTNSHASLTEPLFDLLRLQVTTSPSILTPLLLERAEALAQPSAGPVLQAVRGLQRYWQHQERLRQLLRCLQERNIFRGSVTTNLWIDCASTRWLAVVGPNPLDSIAARDKKPGAQTNQTSVSFFAKPVLERAFADAIHEGGVSLPRYFGLRLELEGESLNVPDVRPSTSTNRAPARLLASSAGVLSQPAIYLSEPDNPPSGPEFESMPSHPRFSLGIVLADPALLYARQRQRTFWFGAVILCVALAAVIGFIRARRAFLREHQLSELKTNFVSSVSHELRAPIASVRLMAESLERGKVPDPERQREYFRFIVQECRRLSSLVANVLDFSRIEQGRKQYEFEPTDVTALIRETVKLMEVYAAEREVTLALQLPEAPAPAQATPRSAPYGNVPTLQSSLDSRAIQQALINLIDNAIKHSPKASAVTIGLDLGQPIHHPPPSDLCPPPSDLCPPPSDLCPPPSDLGLRISDFKVWVEDHGPGIPASEHERIFERFYRLGSELRRETQGVGIGLSIVKHIVEAHHGRVTVRSAPGQGSRFTIELPLA